MLTEEKKNQEPVIQKLRVEYNDLQESTSAKIAEMHSQILDFTKQMMDVSEKLSTTGKSLEETTKERNELAMELSHNKTEKGLGDRENSLLNNQLKTMTADKDRMEQKLSALANEVQMKDIELKALQQEVKHLKDQSADMRSVLQEKSNDLAKSEEEKTSLQEKLQNSNEVVEKQKKDLNDAQTRVVSNFSQEEDIKTQVALEQANVLKYKSLYDKTRAELNIMKDQISNISSLEDTLQQELYYSKSEADERLFEINQLKSLISQLDYTQSKLVDKLKLTIAELEETKRSKKEIEDMCSMQDEAKSEVEVSKLKSVIKDVDSEKDKLQNELDSKCERIKKLEEVVENQSMELHSAKIELSNSQIKIRDVEQGFKSFKDEYDSILGQCKRLHADNLAVQKENSNARQEINALSEDMTQMAREQQIVNADLVKAVNERNDLHDEFQVLQRKTIEQEKIIEMKLKEIKEYTIAYKDLGIDNQEVLAKISHLEREIMEKNALLVAKDSELNSMNDILSNLEVENRQAVSDLTSYEAATSELTNALSTAESQIDKESRDKVTLIERANISKQNALLLESTRNAMQNELYKMEVKTDTLSKTLENVRDENVYLREQFTQQDSKEKNLESIIADFRNRTFASAQVGKEVEASDSYMILQADLERTTADYEKVSKLYSELKETSLAESAHSFGIADATKEIESLRSDNERLIDLLAKAETESTELRVKAEDALEDNKALQKAVMASPRKGSGSSSSTSRDSAGSTPASKGMPGKSPRGKLQEQLQALKQENLRLRSNLEATQATVGKMGSEINKVRAEYESVVREFTGLGDE
jgi:chromosome segregation ATPase